MINNCSQCKKPREECECKTFPLLSEILGKNEILTTLKHARVFITTREKMHKTGVELYDKLIEKLEQEERWINYL